MLSVKPVKNCSGCALNFEKNCGIFHHPALKWKNRKCEGYNNPLFVQHYEKTLKHEGVGARPVKRADALAARR